MKITTKSGSVYDISHGICKKYTSDGELVETFKVYGIKPFNTPIKRNEIYDLPDGDPKVGMCIFIWGRDVSWYSTPIVSIEEN